MEDKNDIIGKLSAQGLRMTPQRQMILAAIENTADHISVEEIHSQVVERFPGVNLSTVYRTLEMLEKTGLVTRTDMGGGRIRYHAAEKGHHHHLVCRECGAVIDLDDSVLNTLKDSLYQKYGFIAELRHMAIGGRCANCLGKSKEPHKEHHHE